MARRRTRTRADLLAAARQVFAAHGFHAASIAEITATADVGVGTFYLYFHDKEALLAVLLEEGRAQLAAEVRAAVADVLPPARLAVLIRTLFRYTYAHRDVFMLVLTGGQSLEQALRSQGELAEALLQALDAADPVMLTGYDLPLLAQLLSGVISQGILWWRDHDTPGPDQMADQVLQLLRAGLPAALIEESRPAPAPASEATATQ